eukprot:m51a1_g1744 putative tectonin beta-propeller repeat-containing protein 1 (304) ;mRNA; r:191657-193335
MRTTFLLFAAVLSVTADDNFWTSVPGLKAQNLEADAAGNLWAVDSEIGSMWFLGVNQNNWTVVDEIGVFAQVSVNDVGVVWAIGGTEQEPTTPHVLRRVGITPQRLTGTGWETIQGAMTQLSVGPRGNVVAVDWQNKIYFRKGVTSRNPSGSSWQVYESTLLQVSYSNNGQIWGTNADTFANLRRDTSTWAFPQGSAWDRSIPAGNVIAVSQAGQVWVRIMVPVASSWVLFDTSKMLQHVSWSSNWQIWGVDMSGNVVMRVGASQNPTGTTWTRMSGSLKSITINSFGQIWGTSIDGKAWYSL